MSDETESRTFSRDAASDIWRHTLSQIPTLFGRLVYLASVRDGNSGKYRHHGLAARFGLAATHKALLESHLHTFAEWLQQSLAQQKEDLSAYLHSVEDDPQQVLLHWRTMEPHRYFVPDGVNTAERELYLADFALLLVLLMSAHGVSGPGRESLPHQ